MNILTDKQKKFCREYLKDFNGKQAAIRSGYSKRTAEVQASRLLSYAKVINFLSGLKKKLSERNDNLADRVVKEFEKLGFSNVQDYIDEGNAVKDFTEIQRDTAAAIGSIKKSVTTFGDGKSSGEKVVTEFKLHDKIAALEKLGRYAGIFEKDNAQSKPQLITPLSDNQVNKIISALRHNKHK